MFEPSFPRFSPVWTPSGSVPMIEPPTANRNVCGMLGGGPAILVAEDLSPSETAHVDTRRVLGLITAGGGPTSHTANTASPTLKSDTPWPTALTAYEV